MCAAQAVRESEQDLMEAGGSSEDRYEFSIDGASSRLSMDGLSLDLLGESGGLSFSTVHGGRGGSTDDCGSSSGGSSPLGWPLAKRDRLIKGPLLSSSSNVTSERDTCMWEERRETTEADLAEVEMMKEKFAKLLLGEDMSGGAKGVCTAMAISNAITNLSASVFGALWRLEPFAAERRAMWRREMEWLLSVSDFIVELVPTWQRFPDGSALEVMVSRPRSDIHVNLPALRKLDNMLLDSLDSYYETEFWYVDRGIAVAEKNNWVNSLNPSLQRQEEKWWLPTPKVPANGLSEKSRKRLHHHRDATSQILKAATAINTQILSEMEVPAIYLNSLPKSGRSSLGELLYRSISADNFSVEAFLSTLDTSDEHNILDIANRLEAAVLVWRQQTHLKHAQLWVKEKKSTPKASWGKIREFVGDGDRMLLLADKAESVLVSLKQRVPGLPQTSLDTSKIQFNRDVGQSILESYSRVLESLAFNIIARVDDVLYADDQVRHSLSVRTVETDGGDFMADSHPSSNISADGSFNNKQLTCVSMSFSTPFVSPGASPTSPVVAPGSAHNNNSQGVGTLISSVGKAFSEHRGGELPGRKEKQEPAKLVKLPSEPIKPWTHAGNLESSNALHSPPGRD
ncbi:hypothetical protein BDL97_15G047200 [Sphagnum fallax]|nr:hypothetical protein BDL97_15G047200 [Sphagnum fallax]